MTTYIYAKAFYFEDEVKGPGYLPILDNGTFGAFQTEKPESGATIIDYGNYQIAPGLVDTHIHGFKGARRSTSYHFRRTSFLRSHFLLTNNLNRISRIISGCLPNSRR